MKKTSEHDAIRQFMERAARGDASPGRKMKYDPKLKRFVVVDEADTTADDLPEVTPEDLQSFAAPQVVLHETPLRAALAAATGDYALVALEDRDEGDVWIVSGAPGNRVAIIGQPEREVKTYRGLGIPKKDAESAKLVVMIGDDGLQAMELDGTRVGDPVPVRVVPSAVDLFHRTRGLYETDALAEKKVGVIGVGSGGSFIVRELVKAGVGHFVLVDHDRMEIGNVCRHECGLSDVGRLKVHAVRDLILDRNPHAEVTALSLKVDGSTLGQIEEAMADVDLLIVATDNRASRLLLNRLAIKLDKPAFFAAVFRRAYGGQVLRVIPGLTPCYQCFVDALPEAMEDQEISSPETADAIAYSDRPVAIEPGLSTDILPVALQVAKLSILELLGPDTTFAHLRDELVTPLFLWLNRREPGTDYEHLVAFENNVDGMSVLRWYGIYLPRNTACPTCGAYESGMLEHVGVEVEDEDVAAFRAGAQDATAKANKAPAKANKAPAKANKAPAKAKAQG